MNNDTLDKLRSLISNAKTQGFFDYPHADFDLSLQTYADAILDLKLSFNTKCFKNCLDYVLTSNFKEYKYVIGILKEVQIKGKKYNNDIFWHSWITVDDVIIDLTLMENNKEFITFENNIIRLKKNFKEEFEKTYAYFPFLTLTYKELIDKMMKIVVGNEVSNEKLDIQSLLIHSKDLELLKEALISKLASEAQEIYDKNPEFQQLGKPKQKLFERQVIIE